MTKSGIQMSKQGYYGYAGRPLSIITNFARF